MALEEADHRRVLPHRLDMVSERSAGVCRGAGVGDEGCRTENEGAQARDQGFQEMTSSEGTTTRRAPQ